MIFNSTFRLYLQRRKLFTKEDLDALFAEAEEKNAPLYDIIVDERKMSEDKIFEELAAFLGIEYRALQFNELNFELITKFPLDKLLQYKAMPIDESNTVVDFGCSDPTFFNDVRNFRTVCGKQIKIYLLSTSNSKKCLDYVSNKLLQVTALDESKEPENISVVQDESIDIDAPVIKLCDSILREAVDLGASDIHIEPFEDIIRCRLRIDGVLVENSRIVTNIYQAVLARFKIMAAMNIAERRVPQDGKINLMVNGRNYDFRVSSLPCLFGEKLVIRIYDTYFNSSDFKALGLDENQEKTVLRMITRPHGIVLLTGPTGSGKSTTLYSFLRYLNTIQRNIITVEDPVENQIYGINQVQVNNKANMTFSNALRAILRQDPNVIMIGEIRDEETALIATRAAITGHLVLSTIHTNDAVGVVSRLINMNIPRYLVSDSLIGAISQRLVRRLCRHCKKEVETTPQQMAALHLNEKRMIYEPVGCKYCNNSGYSGRLGLFEIMVNTKKIKQCIMDENITSYDLEKISNNEGKVTLLEEAKKKVLAGETSFQEYEKLSDFTMD